MGEENVTEKNQQETEDIYLEVDLKILDRIDLNLTQAEDAMINAITALRLSRNTLLRTKVDNFKETMINNEDRIASLEAGMIDITDKISSALKRVDEKKKSKKDDKKPGSETGDD
jgi:ABC-type protease/lipase transport system fused ATPase/permease subunit